MARWLVSFVAFWALCVTAGSLTGISADKDEGRKLRLRLYAPATQAGERKYYTGYDWLQLKMNQKIQMVEMARTGALRINAVMTLPAETYVRELDRMFRNNPQILTMELGQAIEGIAIALKDWDDGTDPDKKILEMTGSQAPSGTN